MKICTRCNRDLPLYAFGRDKTRKDGLFAWCAECKSKARKEAYLLSHPDARGCQEVDTSGRRSRDLKLCIDCLEEKPIGQFHRKRSATDGHTPYCKECGNSRSAAWQQKNKNRVSMTRLEWRRRSPRTTLNINLRDALKRCPTENPATLDDLMEIWDRQEGKCAASGLPMTWAQGGLKPTSITLDRIDPEKGYSASNLRLLCYAVNSFKGRMCDAEMLAMAKAIVANMEKTVEPTWQSFPAFTSESDFMVLH